jgi:hypothetical protein
LREVSKIFRSVVVSVGSMLYSDIGSEYYAKLGWIPTTSNTQLEVLASESIKLMCAEYLTSEKLEELCIINQEVRRVSLVNDETSSKKMAVIPDLQHMQWHHAKEESVRLSNSFREDALCQRYYHWFTRLEIWVVWTHRYDSDPRQVPNENTL